MKKLIKNGTIVLEDKVIQGDLLIEDEVIAAIGQDLEADGEQVIDASGMVVLPGGIDVHTHFNIDVGVRSVDDFSRSMEIYLKPFLEKEGVSDIEK